jgi:hypothetical protein
MRADTPFLLLGVFTSKAFHEIFFPGSDFIKAMVNKGFEGMLFRFGKNILQKTGF